MNICLIFGHVAIGSDCVLRGRRFGVKGSGWEVLVASANTLPKFIIVLSINIRVHVKLKSTKFQFYKIRLATGS